MCFWKNDPIMITKFLEISKGPWAKWPKVKLTWCRPQRCGWVWVCRIWAPPGASPVLRRALPSEAALPRSCASLRVSSPDESWGLRRAECWGCCWRLGVRAGQRGSSRCRSLVRAARLVFYFFFLAEIGLYRSGSNWMAFMRRLGLSRWFPLF